MHLTLCEHPVGNVFLVVDYSLGKEADDIVMTDLNESSMPENRELTNCVIFKGRNLSETINLNRVLKFQNDEFLLISHSVFMLSEKYYTINQVRFTNAETGAEEIKGHEVADKLKIKNNNAPLYGANLLLALTKNLKFCYVNVDSLLWDTPDNLEKHKMIIYDKIYG